MHPRAAQLVAALALAPHPEGGYYREVYRSSLEVVPRDGRSARAALTVIHFLLTANGVSRWHRVASDESWHFHEGAALRLLVAPPDFSCIAAHQLGAWSGETAPVYVVGQGQWQAAQTTGAYSLVSCSVGPGFQFDDFEMARDCPDVVETIRRKHPNHAAWI